MNERLIQSKIMAAAGSTIIDISGCELFEDEISAFIGATLVGKPTGITTETLSKIWPINHDTTAYTSKGDNSVELPRWK